MGDKKMVPTSFYVEFVKIGRLLERGYLTVEEADRELSRKIEAAFDGAEVSDEMIEAKRSAYRRKWTTLLAYSKT